MRLSSNRAVAGAAATYCWLFRGTPLLVQLLIIYTGLPLFGLRFTPRLEFHAWRGELRPRPAARKAQAAAAEAAAEAADAAAVARPLALFGEADERAVRAAERRAGAKARREQRFA
jgi:ABC-type amino acid transport system permease subunit